MFLKEIWFTQIDGLFCVVSYNYCNGVLTCPYCVRIFINKIDYFNLTRAH